MLLPNVAAMKKWVNNFFPAASSGSQDYLQLVRASDGTILGWIDENGIGQGSLSVVGPQGPAGAPGTSNVPWVDIQNYGGVPKPKSIAGETTSAVTTGGSPNVTLGAAKTFSNGSGVCIWKAGAATTQTTPTTPTITSPAVTGSQTLNYKLVGFKWKRKG